MAVLTLSAMVQCGSDVHAQIGGSRFNQPFDRPAVSPYLNLFRNGRGGNPILNYYGLVRPQQEFYQQSQDLQRGAYNFQRQNNPQQNQPGQNSNVRSVYTIGTTGHSVSFMSVGSRPNGGGNSGFNPGNISDNQFGGSQFGGAAGGLPGTGSYSGHTAGFGYGGNYGQNNQFQN